MFEFAVKSQVEICGHSYDCDITDNALIEGVAFDFPKIMEAAQGFAELQKSFSAHPDICDDILNKNRELTESCRSFICQCIGQNGYDEVFSERRPNSSEHVQLCAYLFEHITQERQKILNKYIDLPGSGGKRRAAAKSADKAAGETD